MADDEKLREEFEAIHERFLELEKKVDDTPLFKTENKIKDMKGEISELKGYIDEHIKEIHTRSHNQAEKQENEISELKEQFQITLDFTVVLDKDIALNKEVLWGLITNFRENYIDYNEIAFDDKLKELLSKLDGEKSVEQTCDVEKGTAQQTDSTPSKCEDCGRDLILYKDNWICGHGCMKPAVKPKEPTIIISTITEGEKQAYFGTSNFPPKEKEPPEVLMDSSGYELIEVKKADLDKWYNRIDELNIEELEDILTINRILKEIEKYLEDKKDE